MDQRNGEGGGRIFMEKIHVCVPASYEILKSQHWAAHSFCVSEFRHLENRLGIYTGVI